MSTYDPNQRYRVFRDDQYVGAYSDIGISSAARYLQGAYILDTKRKPKGWYAGCWEWVDPDDVPKQLKVLCLLLGIPHD